MDVDLTTLDDSAVSATPHLSVAPGQLVKLKEVPITWTVTFRRSTPSFVILGRQVKSTNITSLGVHTCRLVRGGLQNPRTSIRSHWEPRGPPPESASALQAVQVLNRAEEWVS